jgi:hypothetical protein
VKCPSCGKQRSPDDLFCDGPDGCGFPLPHGKSQHQTLSHQVIVEVRCPRPECGRANASINSFCYFCGAPLEQKAERRRKSRTSSQPPKARARLISGDKEIPIAENPMWISREHFKGIVSEMETTYISRRHLAISFDNGSYYAEDENSANNTWVNGVEIRGKGKHKLKNGDKVDVAGVITVTFRKS